MGKKEFLNDLREALKENAIDESIINNNVVYYENYIQQKVSEGMKEEDIISELGSGRIIAKTIIDAEKKGFKSSYYSNATTSNTDTTTDKSKKYKDKSNNTNKSHSVFGVIMNSMSTKAKIKAVAITLLVLIVIVLLVVLTFKVIFLIVPYLLMMLLIGIVYRFIVRK